MGLIVINWSNNRCGNSFSIPHNFFRFSLYFNSRGKDSLYMRPTISRVPIMSMTGRFQFYPSPGAQQLRGSLPFIKLASWQQLGNTFELGKADTDSAKRAIVCLFLQLNSSKKLQKCFHSVGKSICPPFPIPFASLLSCLPFILTQFFLGGRREIGWFRACFSWTIPSPFTTNSKSLQKITRITMGKINRYQR